MESVPKTRSWLGTPGIILFVGAVGLVAGVVCGLVIGFGPKAPAAFSALMFGFLGAMLGLGLGAFLYAPRWAIGGGLIAAMLMGLVLLACFLFLEDEQPPQQAAEGSQATVLVLVVMLALLGSATGGLSKYLLDEYRLARWRVGESQRVERDRYWTYLRRSTRDQIRLTNPRMELLSVGVYVVLQLRCAFLPAPIAWGLVCLIALRWIFGKWLAITGYRRWRKKYGGPGLSDETAAPRAPDLTSQSASGSEPFLPYAEFDSKRRFETRLWYFLFLILAIIASTCVTGLDGWLFGVCFAVLMFEPLWNAYRYWQKEKQIARETVREL